MNRKWPWHWTMRVHIANALVRCSLRILPPCRYRRELSAMLWTLNMRVQANVAAWRHMIDTGGHNEE